MRRKEGRVSRNMYEGRKDKTKRGWYQGWEVGMSGVGRVSGEGKIETTVLKQQ